MKICVDGFMGHPVSYLIEELYVFKVTPWYKLLVISTVVTFSILINISK